MGTRRNRLIKAVLTSTYNICFREEFKKISDIRHFYSLKNAEYCIGNGMRQNKLLGMEFFILLNKPQSW